jgi:hypothetical protein
MSTRATLRRGPGGPRRPARLTVVVGANSDYGVPMNSTCDPGPCSAVRARTGHNPGPRLPRRGVSEQGQEVTAYTPLGPDRRPCESSTPGMPRGNKRRRLYRRLNCPAALRAIRSGGSVTHRAFLAEERAAIAAGDRLCAACRPEHCAQFKARRGQLA